MSSISKYQEWNKKHISQDFLREELDRIETSLDEIEDCFYRNLEFGTGGMRGELGAGTNRMNVYTVRKVMHGFSKYLIASSSNAKERGVAIAYDCRHQSEEFAKEMVQVLGYYGIKAFLFDSLRPTPLLSFAVRELNAFAGIMITASHNPPKYNGIKIYAADGNQISIEMTNDIIDFVNKVENELELPFLNFLDVNSNGRLQMIGEHIDNLYLDKMNSICSIPEKTSDLKIVFTPLHGTSYKLIPDALKRLGYINIIKVEEQMHPDPDFLTVASPNPEDHEAFEYAFKYGENHNADLLLATDPDADRLGVAVRDNEGKYKVLTGNQTGALMLEYLLRTKAEANTLSPNGIVIKTIVTSEIGRAIAEKYNISTLDTLTGFKFIGEKINEFEESEENKFLFGYEESYGYLIGDFVRDKDAIQAALLITEVANDYYQKGMTLYDGLQSIWQRYGFYQEDLISLTLKGKEGALKIQKMLEVFRQEPIESIGGLRVEFIEDYLSREKVNLTSGEKLDLDFPASNVIKFQLENNAWIALRPSGTEPKVKLYFGVKESTLEGSQSRLSLLKEEMMKRFQDIE